MANLSLAKLPWYAQIGAFVLISIIAAGSFYYFVEMKKQAAMEVKARELSDLRGRISRGASMARQLPEFRRDVTALEARLEALKPILPDERDVGDLLRRVHTLATQSNLQVVRFSPQAITTREMHAEWPIALSLEGNYHDLGLFLDRVSKFPRIINIGGLTLAAQPTPGSTSMTIQATATTFVLVDAPPPAADVPGKKGAKKTPPKKAPAKKQ